MVSRRRISRIGPVAIETLGTHMAPVARLGSGIGNRTMNLGKIPAVRRGPLSLGAGAFASSWPGHREHSHRSRLPDMAGEAALLSMTSGAGSGRLASRPSVPKQELGVPMIGGSLELGLDGGRAGIHSQSLDRRHLGSIHVALNAEIAGMARSTGC